ncbi:MAG: hypothetical protein A2888_00485 [Chlamydiae bacterium RIFCSPLOWO2_01_FULL_28_7]|nr:MAG: hypothetical protein A2888_00485 [Chlamydiae bacterium RIFCSPLOWO2_01_FULL_28_7]
MQTTGKNLSLYFHIPFCLKKCPYCQFYSTIYNKNEKDILIDAILKHINIYKNILDSRNIVSIYFGGGTPSLLDSKDIEKILNFLTISKNCEITIEANPDFLKTEKIKDLKNSGINRLSIGAQTFNDSLLKKIGRTHSSEKTKEIILEAFKIGFENISIDLMYDLPNENLIKFENSLNEIKKLPISHVSLYNLVIEENTPFFKIKNKLKKIIPDNEESLKILNHAVNFLSENNFKRYEISAFSKNNKISIHNMGYWTQREFLGLGPSAFSYFENKRFKNISNTKKYSENIFGNKNFIEFEEVLNYPNNLLEHLIVNLRVLEGINLEKFEKNLNLKIPDTTIEFLKNSEFIEFEENFIKLNAKGINFYDNLAIELI